MLKEFPLPSVQCNPQQEDSMNKLKSNNVVLSGAKLSLISYVSYLETISY